jgi:hypothetical protein
MALFQIFAEVHCTQPSWVLVDLRFPRPKYRLYLCDELLSERTWTYGNDHIVDEEIYANLELRKEYIIRIEPVVKPPVQAKFIISNFRTPDQEHAIVTSDDLSVTFKLQ